MKRLRNFRTSGDFFYCEVTFILTEEDDLDLHEDFAAVPRVVDGCHLRMSFLIRYPKGVKKCTVKTRFACISHPNLSPVLVAEEASYFLSLIHKMQEL